MNTTQASHSTRWRVGMFTVLGLILIGAVTVYVNDKPYWWRACQLVHINVEDATGLKTKSPVRSLGLEIGYLSTIELSETYVRLGICITAPVDVLPSTRAYLRADGFLGDKFVELKPVKYAGPKGNGQPAGPAPAVSSIFSWLIPSAFAEDQQAAVQAQPPRPTPPPRKGEREIPVGAQSQDIQHLVNQVDDLVGEMSNLTNNLKQAINPAELRQTMQQLNRTLESASRTLSPEGGLNSTAQRTLAKLEDAIEQLRDQMARVNKGEGSVGMLLNDPIYAEEIHTAIKNINLLLSKVSAIRFAVDIGAEEIAAYGGTRGWFRLGVWSKKDRYYLLGISIDPRGKRTVTTTTSTTAGSTTETRQTVVEEGSLLFTAMIGRVLWRRLDVSVGALHNDGVASVNLLMGPYGVEDALSFRTDLYSRGQGTGLDARLTATIRPLPRHPLFSAIYFKGGVEGVKRVNGKIPYIYGAALTFDDEDIKLLFSLY